MLFVDRLDAAERLSQALQIWKGHRPLVLAIPRGALAIGRVLAERLEGDLDLVLVRKLRAPGSPEFAVGAIDESGWAYIAPYAGAVGADESCIETEKRLQLEVLKDRREQVEDEQAMHLLNDPGRFAPSRPQLPPR